MPVSVHAVPKKAVIVSTLASIASAAPAMAAEAAGDDVDNAIGSLVDVVKSSGDFVRSGISAAKQAADAAQEVNMVPLLAPPCMQGPVFAVICARDH